MVFNPFNRYNCRVNNAKKIVKNYYKLFSNDSLYRNSVTLLFASLVNAGFSFFFWIIAARFYTRTQVGEATAIISAGGLIAGFGMLGFNNSIIKFLPKAKKKNKLINSALIVVSCSALVALLIFILFLPHISKPLLFIRDNRIFLILFTVFVLSTVVNGLIDNIFTSFRATQYTLLKNVLLNISEILLVLLLIKNSLPGIFSAYAVTYFAVVIFGITVLVRKFHYRPKFEIDTDKLKQMSNFSLANYVVSYLNGLPGLVLPVLIATLLGAQLNAVFFVAYSIASLLFYIPLGVGNALFAEGVNAEEPLMITINKAAKILSLLMLPAILCIYIFAPLLLYFFGKGYSAEGVGVLRVLSLSALFLAISYPCGSILNILHKLKLLIAVNFFGALSVVSSVYFMVSHGRGIVGAAWGWLFGWALYSIFYTLSAYFAVSKAS